MEFINKVMRDQNSKWYVSHKEWPPNEYPPYCSGSGFIYTPDFAASAFNMSKHIPYFWIDDLYITGFLPM